ncbi:hypothetical protein QN372_00365 [Undibacterium sp. RTI2.1]|uniref:hypothetical protein n=1 Tax=unclassified Undibacterium TaxID=2630295 RepID=UPI002B22FB93|nr:MULTISPECIES: hypothetical protein [unclassified Undibacterium]MEB0029192.1 hypothetical protein [Undibacterium sp. RTI2.1]MEB0115500.1 hypothetical protein [Undibacterium sp. RTI2.2]
MTEKETTRYTIIMTKDKQERLAGIAKEFKISQQEVLEVLIDHIGNDNVMADLAPKFFAVRENKVSQREQRKTSFAKLRKLSPEQIALIEQMSAKQ